MQKCLRKVLLGFSKKLSACFGKYANQELKHYLQQKEEFVVFFSARLIAIVEVYDVLIHDRPYKQKMNQQEALQELERCAGTQSDPNLIRLFLDNAYYITNSSSYPSDVQGCLERIGILALFLLCEAFELPFSGNLKAFLLVLSFGQKSCSISFGERALSFYLSNIIFIFGNNNNTHYN